MGNTAAGMKEMHDTYQTAQREYNTTTEKIAYMAGTLLAGYAMGKVANWGANKLKNLANKALPKLKTAVQEGAGKFTSKVNEAFGSFENNIKYRKLSNKSTELVRYYPLNNGALIGTEKTIYLMAGDKIDRFERVTGKYFSPTGTPMEMRALPYDADLSQYR